MLLLVFLPNLSMGGRDSVAETWTVQTNDSTTWTEQTDDSSTWTVQPNDT
jgi:hypothetical protein